MSNKKPTESGPLSQQPEQRKLEDRFSEAERERKEATARVGELEAALQSVRAELGSLAGGLEAAEERLLEAQQNLEDRLSEAERKRAEPIPQLDTLEVSLQSVQVALGLLAGESAATKARLLGAQQNLEDRLSEAEHKRAEPIPQVDALEVSLQSVQVALGLLPGELAAVARLFEAHQKLEDRLSEAEREGMRATSRADALEASLQSVHAALDSLPGELAATESRLLGAASLREERIRTRMKVFAGFVAGLGLGLLIAWALAHLGF